MPSRSLDDLTRSGRHLQPIEIETNERCGKDANPVRRREGRVHHDDRLATDPAKTAPACEERAARAQRLDAHGNPDARRERLELGENAHRCHPKQASISLNKRRRSG
jgi:hypothetical protein